MITVGWHLKNEYDGVTYWGRALGEQKEVKLTGYGDMLAIEPLAEAFSTSPAGFMFRILAIHATALDLAEAAVIASRGEEMKRHAALKRLGG